MPRPKMTIGDKAKAFAYINEWQKGKYDRIGVIRLKGDKSILADIAKSRNMSLNAFMNMCIDKELKRMKLDIEELRLAKSTKDKNGEKADEEPLA